MPEQEAEDPVRSYLRNPTIRFLPIGHEDVLGTAGGPITEAGWYVDPYCDPGCCRPNGPFSTRAAAAAWAAREAEKPAPPEEPLSAEFLAALEQEPAARDADDDE